MLEAKWMIVDGTTFCEKLEMVTKYFSQWYGGLKSHTMDVALLHG